MTSRRSLIERLDGRVSRGHPADVEMRDSIVENIRFLLATASAESVVAIAADDPVVSSVWNIGIRDLTGAVGRGLATPAIERDVRRAIEYFEPRLDPSSLVVRVDFDDQESSPRPQLNIAIEADVIGSGRRLLIRHRLDTETSEAGLSARLTGSDR